ncbi:MAG TPA: zinc ABC transporter substrate-binding protein [Phycisphaerales bacterium]|nr:zinc ABC transporter substrate-binding protein [Phycisphaerales bacterium]HMP38460.1 zinc ABC transporter substrate-binding protein [Phycisphaerales bacterium]
MPARPIAILVAIAAALGLSGCGSPAPSEDAAEGRLRVVATTGLIGDLARTIGGERVHVRDLMGPGVDPHLYKASPGDLRLLRNATLVLHHGLHLEGRLGEALQRLGDRTPTVEVTDSIDRSLLRSPPEFEGAVDPHVWLDPRLWSMVAERVRDALIDRDPDGEEHFRANASALVAQLSALHGWAASQFGSLPADRRLLVTAHDAFGYLGAAYGLEVLSVQGVSTESEPSLKSINALVELLAERRVPAVFVESTVPPKTMQALVEGCAARGHALRIGGELLGDALGPAGTPEATYAGMFRHNIRTIVEALLPDGAEATRE